jgi:hypothetical protein
VAIVPVPATYAQQIKTLDLASQKLVLADYLNQWENLETSGEWDGWSYHACGVSDTPQITANKTWTHVASIYSPLIGLYDASDDAVIEYHIRLAQASGIDAFVVEWDGILNYYDFPTINENFASLLKVAERLGFGVAILYDAYRFYVGATSGGTGRKLLERTTALKAIQDDLAYAIQKYGSSSAYLKIRGQPVIFTGTGLNSLEVTEWAQIIGSLNNEGYTAYYIAQQAYQNDMAYYPTFNGFSPWLDWTPDPISFINDRAALLSEFQSLYGIHWGLSVWPGFDNSRVNAWCSPSGVTRFSRLNGALYNRTWTTAIQNAPEWVYITTWNDWNEATIIEPSTQFRYQYLYATAYYSAQFKGQTPDYDGIPVPLAIYNATLALRQAQAEGRTVGLDSANQTLNMAEQAFQTGQYSSALTYANQAYQLANKATSPPISTITSPTSSEMSTPSEMSGGQMFLSSLPEWYWLLLSTIMVAGVILIIVVRRRK